MKFCVFFSSVGTKVPYIYNTLTESNFREEWLVIGFLFLYKYHFDIFLSYLFMNSVQCHTVLRSIIIFIFY